MATHEREITEPVHLCLPGGKVLNPLAKGWSRRPLHDANLVGRWGRTKKWDYWAILVDDLALSITYADVGYLGMAHVWWADLATGVEGGYDRPLPGARGVSLPDRPGTAPLRHAHGTTRVDLVDDDGGTTITARWTEPDGAPASLDVRIDLPEGHESLNVVIPWSDRTFQFTTKDQARPARGTLTVGDRRYEFGVPVGDEPQGGAAWGVLDVGRGRWPYSTRWNWGGGGGLATDGSTVIGLQFGAKWTEGTGFTENGVLVDGRLSKIGAELEWTYDWDHPLHPWRVRHPDGSLDVTLHPVHDRHTKVSAVVLATEVHQVFGRWSGHVTDDATGTRHEIDGLLGFAEECRNRW